MFFSWSAKFILSITALARASPVAHPGKFGESLGPADLVVVPIQDTSVDRRDLTHLLPSTSVTLQYAQPPLQLQRASIKFNTHYPVVVLENSALLSSIACSSYESQIEIKFDTPAAFEIGQTWTTGDTILVTNQPDCNPSTERGVSFISHASVTTFERTIVFETRSSSWQEVADTMEISYHTAQQPNVHFAGHKDGLRVQKRAGRSCTILKNQKFRCGTPGSLSAPSYLPYQPPSTVKTLDACRDACLSRPKCVTLSFGLGQCKLMGKPLNNQGFTRKQKSTTVFYNRKCFVCEDGTPTSPTSSSSASASSTPAPDPDALTPAEQVIYDDIVSGIRLDESGAAIADFSKLLPSESVPIEAPEVDFDDESKQAEHETALTADGLATVEQVAQSTANDLADDFGELDPADSGFTFVEGGGDGAADKRRRATPGESHADLAGRSTVNASLALSRRFGLSDVLDWGEAALCNDFTTTISDKAEAACGGIEAGKAINCYVNGCGGSSAPPQTKSDFTVQYSVAYPALQNRNLYQTSAGQILCVNCDLTVSNLQLQGTILVVMSTSQIVSGSLTVTQNSVSNLVMQMKSNGPFSGTWNYDISTAPLSSISSPGLFAIAPTMIYGIGVNWETDKAMDVKGGAKMTLSGAATDIDIVNGRASGARNWQPSGEITYPSLPSGQAARLVFNPFLRTTIRMSVQIFGRSIQNIAALTTQTNIGFDAQRLATNTANKERRDIGEAMTGSSPKENVKSLEARGFLDFLSMFPAIAAALAAAGKAAAPSICPAGSLQLKTSMTTVNNAAFSGSGGTAGPASELYNNKFNFKGQCFSIPATPPVPTGPACQDSTTSGTCYSNGASYTVISGKRLSGASFTSSTYSLSFKGCLDWCVTWGDAGKRATYSADGQCTIWGTAGSVIGTGNNNDRLAIR